MKKFLLIVILAVVLVGFVVPQFFLDAAYAMDRSTTMKASPAEIHRVVGDLQTWDDWTVWNTEKDATLVRTFEGDAGEPGHKMTWTGDELGKGEIVLTSISATRIEYDMIFDGSDAAKCAIVLAPSADGTTGVTWEMAGEFTGMPFERWFGLMMDGMVGPDFEEGLARLKARVEGTEVSTDDAPSDDSK